MSRKGNRRQQLDAAIQRSENRSNTPADKPTEQVTEEQLDALMADAGVTPTSVVVVQKPDKTWAEHLAEQQIVEQPDEPEQEVAVNELQEVDDEFSLENLVETGVLDEEFEGLMSGLIMGEGDFTNAVVQSAASKFNGIQ